MAGREAETVPSGSQRVPIQRGDGIVRRIVASSFAAPCCLAASVQGKKDRSSARARRRVRKPYATEGSGGENCTTAATQAPLMVSINIDGCGLVLHTVFARHIFYQVLLYPGKFSNLGAPYSIFLMSRLCMFLDSFAVGEGVELDYRRTTRGVENTEQGWRQQQGSAQSGRCLTAPLGLAINT